MLEIAADASRSTAERATETLRARFGLTEFRPWQQEAIEALLDGPGRVLVVAPTGGGKSLTYQLPAAMLEGTTLVISPLVALMEDQVRSLTARGIRATYLASTLDRQQRDEREQAMLRGDYELVYVAPERLASDVFVRILGRCRIALVAIDEAHCIAQWGHDFRPDYLRIGALLERLAPPRILACTATATPEVRREIKERLGFDREGSPCREVLRGFARPNLHLAARNVDGPKQAREGLLETLASSLGSARLPVGGAIVYAATRKTTEQYAEMLGKQGWSAAAYHAGMAGDARSRVADRFASRKVSVVVATNAFGMGIDRPDIRAVVHVQPPSSIEAYYQEVGRAGRDGDQAHGLLLCSGADIALRRRLVQGGGDGTPTDPVLAARAWGLFRELLRYLDARTCRHDFVLRYFGDEQETLGGCGHCDVCLAIDAGEVAPDSEASAETTLVVRKALAAVARAQRRAGLVAIADMLKGVDSEKTRKFGFTGLSTFGLLSDRSPAWIVALLRALLAAGWIDLTTNEHPVPFLTKAGADVMKEVAPARLVLPAEPRAGRTRSRSTSSGGSAREGISLDASLQPLFERLRAHRAEVAKARGVPAYVVALDRTLVEMASVRPRSLDQLLMIHGMGPARAEQYGEGFLRVVSEAASAS
ncbi:MAG: ATP-dependent helicase RecQ [Labilithrix sp.]|nr:ATP-dependent helicase RecQ [Labilithrix sp.]